MLHNVQSQKTQEMKGKAAADLMQFTYCKLHHLSLSLPLYNLALNYLENVAHIPVMRR
jgi:hypothetical protein